MSEASLPLPVAAIDFHTEAHPDPLVQALIERIEELEQENQQLKDRLHGTDSR